MIIKYMREKIQYNSPTILTFTFLALLVYVIGWITNGFTTYFLFTNYRTSFLDPFQYLRLFSHILGHSDWQHFAANFTIILLVGPMVEEKYGSLQIIKMMLITSFVTGLLNTLIFPTALLGASGIAFMFILMGSFANVQDRKIPLTFIIILVVFLGREVINAFLIKDNISQFAHVIGGVTGSCFGYLFNKK